MAKQSKTLVKEAEALGIDVDGRWGDETIQEKIDEAKSAREAANREQKDYAEETRDGVEAKEAGSSEPVLPGSQPEGKVASGQTSTGDSSGELAGSPASGEAPAGLVDGDARRPQNGQPVGGDEGQSTVLGAGEPTADERARHDAETLDRPVGETDETAAVEDPGDGSADGAAPETDRVVGDEGKPLDGLPADPEPLSEEDREKAIETARVAMIGPINAAFSAATAFFASDGEDGPIGFDVSWFAGEAYVGDFLPALVGVAVPFVRTWPDAPPEALYGHMRTESPVLEHVRPWADLELRQQLAWQVFRDVLVTVDGALATEAKRRGAGERSELRGGFDAHDGTTLETFEDPLAVSQIGRQRG